MLCLLCVARPVWWWDEGHSAVQIVQWAGVAGLARDLDEHFVEMPLVAQARLAPAWAGSVGLPNLLVSAGNHAIHAALAGNPGSPPSQRRDLTAHP